MQHSLHGARLARVLRGQGRRGPAVRLGGVALAAVAAGAGLAASPATGGTQRSSAQAAKVVGNPVAGKRIFSRVGCKGCHTLKAAKATGNVGPNLDKARPAYALVVRQVTNGGHYMPAFQGKLSAKEIRDVAAFVYGATHAARTTKVAVQAGRPSEFAFKLSRKRVPVGKVVFTVVNKGKATHTFKVCSSRKGGKANTCKGKATKTIAPHKKRRLTIDFKKKGRYEYLCTIPGHAAAGMKGILRVT